MQFDNKNFLETIKKNRKKKKQPKIAAWKKYYEPGLYEYVMYLSSPIRIFFINLLAGIGRGLGLVLGATVLVALVVYIVSKILVDIPIVGDSFKWLDQILQENLQQKSLKLPETEREY